MLREEHMLNVDWAEKLALFNVDSRDTFDAVVVPRSLSDLEIVGCNSAAAVHFLPHSRAMGLQIRQKLFSLGPIFAIDAPSPTGS